jgi:hypothetical protein
MTWKGDRTTFIDDSMSRESKIPAIILLSILALSVFMNMLNIKFGLPYVYGRNVEGRIVALTVNAFASGDLNPHVTIYPHFQLYILLIAFLPYYFWGLMTGVLTSRADLLTVFQTDPTPLYTISRAVTALFGAGCVLMVYLITRRLFGKNTALVASLFLACFPLLVTNSHMVTPDVIMTFFILVSCYYAMNLMRKGRFLDYFMSGAALGLGFATKYPAAAAVIFILCGHLLRTGGGEKEKDADTTWGTLPTVALILLGIVIVILALSADLSPVALTIDRRFPGTAEKVTLTIQVLAVFSGIALVLLPYLIRRATALRAFINRHLGLIIAAVTCTFFTFVGSPYLYLDFSSTLHSLLYHALTSSKPFWGCEDTPVGWIYYIQLLTDGTSLPFVILSIIGVGFLIFRHRKHDIYILSFPLIYFLFMGSFQTKMPRYMVPLLPFLAIFSAALLDMVKDTDGGRAGNRIRRFILVALLLFAIPSFVTSLQWILKMGRVDTRTHASEWIEENIPRGSRLAIETPGPRLSVTDFQLYVAFRGKLQTIPDPWGHYRLGEVKDVAVLVEEEIDYVVINSNTYGNYRRVPHIYPEEYAFYLNLDRQGELIREFLPEGNPGPEIKIYTLPDGDIKTGTIEINEESG